MSGFSPEVLAEKVALERLWRSKAEVVLGSKRASRWAKSLAADLLAKWKGELTQRQKSCLDEAYGKCRNY
jgi:hypothetical protein